MPAAVAVPVIVEWLAASSGLLGSSFGVPLLPLGVGVALTFVVASRTRAIYVASAETKKA